jgi:hypothetical protein
MGRGSEVGRWWAIAPAALLILAPGCLTESLWRDASGEEIVEVTFPVEEVRLARLDGATAGPDAAVLALRFRRPAYLEAAARGEPWLERIARERPCWLLLRHPRGGSSLPVGDGPAAAVGGTPRRLEVEARPVPEEAGAEGVDAGREEGAPPLLAAFLMEEEAPDRWHMRESWECELRREIDSAAAEGAPATITFESFIYRGKVTEHRGTLPRILATPFTVALDVALVIGTAGLITFLYHEQGRQ